MKHLGMSRKIPVEVTASNYADQNHSVQTHYGIRYAKSPTGDLRWRAPVPVDNPGTKLDPAPLNATRPGPICFQGIPGWYLTLKTPLPPLLPGLIGGGGLGGPGGIDLGAGLSEDCLTIDVITPLAPLSNNLPVLVSIHGGGKNIHR